MKHLISSLAVGIVLFSPMAVYGEKPFSGVSSTVSDLKKVNAPHEQMTLVGTKFIDFELNTPAGNVLKLSDCVAKNQYTLVDFWASWCAPCREEMPHVLAVYEKYKDYGFGVAGVSLDSKKDAWIQSITTMKLPWPQMSDLQGWNNKAAKLYNVKSIPSTLLIDRDGIIVAENLRSDELGNKLEELLQAGKLKSPSEKIEAEGIRFSELTLDQALQEAKANNKLVFIDCYTTWCGPCKQLAKVAFKDFLLSDYFNKNFINLKMDMEKGSGIDFKKKYEVTAYPTLLFLDGDGRVVHRSVGSAPASELLKKTKIAVDGGDLATMQRRYEGGERDSAFIHSYIDILADANLKAELQKVAADFIKGKESQLQDKFYFMLFYRYVNDAGSDAFRYVVAHKDEILSQYDSAFAKALEKKMLQNWKMYPYTAFVKREGDKNVLDEQGMSDYMTRMVQAGVKEAPQIEEAVRMSLDGANKNWNSFIKRGNKLLASNTILGDNNALLDWCKLVDTYCADQKIRKQVAVWCADAIVRTDKADEERKKNLPAGAIPAVSMINYQSLFAKFKGQLEKPLEVRK